IRDVEYNADGRSPPHALPVATAVVRRTGRAVSPRGLCPCRFRLLARAGPAGDLGTVPTHSCSLGPWEGVPRGDSRHAAWTRCQALEPAWRGCCLEPRAAGAAGHVRWGGGAALRRYAAGVKGASPQPVRLRTHGV